MVVDHRAVAYERTALAEPDRQWELHDGVLREKPGMTFGHSFAITRLHRALAIALDPGRYTVVVNHGRVRRPDATMYFIPDLLVIPSELTDAARTRRDDLEVYDAPLPLVVEVWSPSTGGYDVDTKFPEYRARGDHEIWRLHPSERTLTAWRRRPNGGYDELVYQGGVVEIMSLPGVWIDLDALFDA